MYLLDTNVVSELRRATAGKADPRVVAWAASVPVASLFLSAITVLELELGVLRIERRDPVQGVLLRAWLEDLVEKWVLSMNLTPLQFMLLSQFIIFILGWPLEWTEIIVIFMPIFIPLLAHFHIDPLFFGLLVALNLQTAFLSPPVAMAAFYLKGVSPPHVKLNQIFAGMLPFMGIQVIAIILLYQFPAIGLWLPSVLYSR